MSVIRVFFLLILAFISPLSAAQFDFVKWNKRDYVTIESMCRYFGYPIPTLPKKGQVKMESADSSMTIEMNQRSFYMNGARAWLSFPIVRNNEGKAILSRLDLEKLILPVMEPEKHIPKNPVKGVVIDPGHGGADRGARSKSGYSEKTAALSTAKFLREILKEENIPYLMTRTTDRFIPLSERADIANRHPDHLFISIHYNAAHHSAHGVETYCLTPRGAGSTSSSGRVRSSDYKSYEGNQSDLQNVILASLIHNEMKTMHSQQGDRGLKRARFVVLRECQVPGVLVEGGFMTNHLDRALIEGDSYKKKVAQAIYRGIRNYMTLSEGGSLPASSDPEESAEKPDQAEPDDHSESEKLDPKPVPVEEQEKPAIEEPVDDPVAEEKEPTKSVSPDNEPARPAFKVSTREEIRLRLQAAIEQAEEGSILVPEPIVPEAEPKGDAP
ncbi:MAG: N-acetylmuramoyl-L-alanine amidase [Verrucomicrobiota bacterium]